MGAKRLSVSRVAGIAAWTTASVAWGTAAVALSAPSPATEAPAETPQIPVPSTSVAQDQLAALPSMPESGLIVLRYTPAERPQPTVVVRTVPAQGTSPSPAASPSAPAPAAAQPAAPAPVTEQSSGS
jgi:hypothetical protein